VRDGVLQYDPSGRFVRRVPLAEASHRWVAQVGKFAYATDGPRLRSLPVNGGPGDAITFGPEIAGLASAGFDSRTLVRADGVARVVRATSSSTSSTPEVTATLPGGFVPTGLAASTTRFWATGTVDGAPAIALLGDLGVEATVVLDHATDGAALAWTAPHTVRAVSDGELYDITVP